VGDSGVTNVTPPGVGLGGHDAAMTTATIPTLAGATTTVDLSGNSLAPWGDIESSVRARLFGHLVAMYRHAVKGTDDAHFPSDLYHDALCIERYTPQTLEGGFAYGADDWGSQILSVQGDVLTLDMVTQIVATRRKYVWTVVCTFTRDAYGNTNVSATITKV
jgi:hypothetical protein